MFFSGKIWVNLAFMTSTSRSEQSKEMYIADIIIPFLQASLSGLPNGSICLSIISKF